MQKFNLTYLLATIVVALISQTVNAKIWRVNNNATGTYGENMGGTAAFPVFKQLGDASNANIVRAGDTIHLEGSNKTYDGATLVKSLVIIGTGYLLPENQNTSANGLQAKIFNITFDDNATSTSAGSQLISVYVGGSSFGTTVSTSNILLKRCRFDYSITLTSDISDITIVQNYFSDTASTASIISTSSFGFPSQVVINNNIIERTLILPNNADYTVSECKNNVFAGPAGTPAIRMYVGYFQNNILVNQNATVVLNGVAGPSSNPNISYNISSLATTQFGTANNNIEANMTALFTNLALNSDAGYQLRPASPGSNTGSDGTDRGAFGGVSSLNRYTLSGLAPIPVIYGIVTSGVAGPAGLQVTVKARTIK